jgi:hypothetical protein
MPPTTCLGKNKWKKKDMDPSLSSSIAWTQPYPIVSTTPLDPPPPILEISSFVLDIDAFINQPGHVTIINAIIDQNRETIMAKFLRDNVSVFDFGRSPPINITDPVHSLFGLV